MPKEQRYCLSSVLLREIQSCAAETGINIVESKGFSREVQNWLAQNYAKEFDSLLLNKFKQSEIYSHLLAVVNSSIKHIISWCEENNEKLAAAKFAILPKKVANESAPEQAGLIYGILIDFIYKLKEQLEDKTVSHSKKISFMKKIDEYGYNIFEMCVPRIINEFDFAISSMNAHRGRALSFYNLFKCALFDFASEYFFSNAPTILSQSMGNHVHYINALVGAAFNSIGVSHFNDPYSGHTDKQFIDKFVSHFQSLPLVEHAVDRLCDDWYSQREVNTLGDYEQLNKEILSYGISSDNISLLIGCDDEEGFFNNNVLRDRGLFKTLVLQDLVSSGALEERIFEWPKELKNKDLTELAGEFNSHYLVYQNHKDSFLERDKAYFTLIVYATMFVNELLETIPDTGKYLKHKINTIRNFLRHYHQKTRQCTAHIFDLIFQIISGYTRNNCFQLENLYECVLVASKETQAIDLINFREALLAQIGVLERQRENVTEVRQASKSSIIGLIFCYAHLYEVNKSQGVLDYSQSAVQQIRDIYVAVGHHKIKDLQVIINNILSRQRPGTALGASATCGIYETEHSLVRGSEYGGHHPTTLTSSIHDCRYRGNYPAYAAGYGWHLPTLSVPPVYDGYRFYHPAYAPGYEWCFPISAGNYHQESAITTEQCGQQQDKVIREYITKRNDIKKLENKQRDELVEREILYKKNELKWQKLNREESLSLRVNQWRLGIKEPVKKDELMEEEGQGREYIELEENQAVGLMRFSHRQYLKEVKFIKNEEKLRKDIEFKEKEVLDLMEFSHISLIKKYSPVG